MLTCPIPHDERERLASLRAQQILDTAPEPEFDVTTRLAARLFDVPIALVALLDEDRLWFKSRHGLALAQLDREIAFCAHAVLQPQELLVVEDLSADPRFAANPLVAEEPRLRFYAGAPLRDDDGRALGTIALLDTRPRQLDAEQKELLRDLSVSVMTALANRHRAQELRRMATTDPLTGLANRVQFETALAVELRQAERQGEPVSVLFLDLDDFKMVNDRFGHAVGDQVLREVAARLSPLLRAGDTLARFGGDEFAIVMRSGADRGAAVTLATRIIEALQPPLMLQGERWSLGASIGIVGHDGEPATPSKLLERADQALYRAKGQPLRRYAVWGTASDPQEFDEPADAPLTMPAVLIASPGAAASRPRCEECAEGIDQPFPFSMAFQPMVRASQRSVFAYEALARGTAGEPAMTVLSRVTRRNRYAFDQSCRRTAIELAARLGLIEQGALLSINFIPGAMYEPENCVRATLKAARRVGLPLDRLVFEVTEGEEIQRPQHLARIFEVYREHGFLPAIDDFGAGYSGLNLLAQFQPHLLKLDRELVRDIDASPARRAIVRGVISVCADLGIEALAEGVETAPEYRALRDLGIDLFQGYLFARPAFEALPPPVFPD